MILRFQPAALVVSLALVFSLGQHSAIAADASGAGTMPGTASSKVSGETLLLQWVKSTRSARTDFTQTVVDDKGKASPTSAGNFEFERPGKFRWIYTKPYRQDIVSDGQTIWTYDHDLDQVTVSPQSRALSGTPAALLSGEDVSHVFVLSALPAAGGLEWVQAVPRGKDSSFDWVRIGLKSTADGPQLVEMQLRDAFRRTSTIVFSNGQRNVIFPSGHFHFKAPQGASVIQQP